MKRLSGFVVVLGLAFAQPADAQRADCYEHPMLYPPVCQHHFVARAQPQEWVYRGDGRKARTLIYEVLIDGASVLPSHRGPGCVDYATTEDVRVRIVWCQPSSRPGWARLRVRYRSISGPQPFDFDFQVSARKP
jgi:hypothetical protein